MSQEMNYCPTILPMSRFIPTQIDHIKFVIQKSNTRTNGSIKIDEVIQESQTEYTYRLQQMSYYNFQDIKYIADGIYGTVHSAKIKKKWV